MESINYSQRLFHSNTDGKDYLLRRNDGKYKSATLFQVKVEDGVRKEIPVLHKDYCPGQIHRQNVLTGTNSKVRNVNGYKLYSELYDIAGKFGIELDTAPQNKIFKEVNINEYGTKLNLLVRDGEIKSIMKGGFCLEPDTFEKLSPFAKKWAKKFLQMLSKAL